MLGTQPGLCCTSLQMASSIQMGLLPCYCFASPDLRKDSSPSLVPPPLVTQLLLSSQFTGDGDTESRDYFGFSDLQKQLLAARGKGGAGARVRVGGCDWEEAVGIAQDWGGKRAGKDPAGT